jgi:LmbE family N-acetylglucosaminyl deacetylase
LLDPRRGDVVAFLHAHPDDESLFTGGTIARLAGAHVNTVLMTATMGELGRPNDPVARANLGDGVPIPTVRKDELARARVALGVTHHVFLGGEGRFRDSGYDAMLRSDDCLAGNVDAAAIELTALLRRVRPQVLVTFGKDGCTGHPDHLACHEIGLRAAAELSTVDDRLCGLALIADPIPRPYGRRCATSTQVEIDIGPVRKRKASAVSCHFSQVGHGVEDQRCLALFDRGSSVARYLPHVLSNGPRSRYERYVWIGADQLCPLGAEDDPEATALGQSRLW